jgi:hypothetical protein
MVSTIIEKPPMLSRTFFTLLTKIAGTCDIENEPDGKL